MLKRLSPPIAALLIIMSLSGAVAHGTEAKEGSEGSGGGNAVVCFDNDKIAPYLLDKKLPVRDKDFARIESVEMLDLYEAHQARGLRKLTNPVIISADSSSD